jgi:hypothetical protein
LEGSGDALSPVSMKSCNVYKHHEDGSFINKVSKVCLLLLFPPSGSKGFAVAELSSQAERLIEDKVP